MSSARSRSVLNRRTADAIRSPAQGLLAATIEDPTEGNSVYQAEILVVSCDVRVDTVRECRCSLRGDIGPATCVEQGAMPRDLGAGQAGASARVHWRCRGGGFHGFALGRYPLDGARVHPRPLSLRRPLTKPGQPS
jgi:hypothetical protein